MTTFLVKNLEYSEMCKRFVSSFPFFYNSRNQNRVFVIFVRFDVLFLIENNRENLQTHQITVQNLRI